MTIVRQTSPESRIQALRSFAIGFSVLCVAYMVPVLGLAAWAIGGVFGLGAATLSIVAGYRRERPAPLPRVPAVEATANGTAEPFQYGDPSPGPVREPVPMPPLHEAAGALTASAGSLAAPDLVSFPRAPFRDRLAAFVLDVILVAIGSSLVDAFLPLLLAYHIGFWTWTGTTVGGIICQLRVIRVDGTPLRFVDALVRGLSSIFSLAVVGLGCLWILKDPERQAWHDKIAGTYVVKVPQHWPL
jgi:hypothetical protein